MIFLSLPASGWRCLSSSFLFPMLPHGTPAYEVAMGGFCDSEIRSAHLSWGNAWPCWDTDLHAAQFTNIAKERPRKSQKIFERESTVLAVLSSDWLLGCRTEFRVYDVCYDWESHRCVMTSGHPQSSVFILYIFLPIHLFMDPCRILSFLTLIVIPLSYSYYPLWQDWSGESAIIMTSSLTPLLALGRANKIYLCQHRSLVRSNKGRRKETEVLKPECQGVPNGGGVRAGGCDRGEIDIQTVCVASPLS